MNSLIKKLGILLTTFTFLLFGFFITAHANQALAHTLSGNVSEASGTDIVGAVVDVIDTTTSNNIGSDTTDSSGNYSVEVNSGTYDIEVTPPGGSGFGSAIAPSRTISGDTVVNFILVPAGPVILSGHVYDRSGNAVPNQTVRLGDSAGNTTSTTTNSNGEYSLQVSPGTFRLDVTGDNNPVTLEIPRRYEITKNGYSLTQSTTLDITIPAKQVITHVQDASGNSISGIEITVVPPTGVSGGGYSIGGGITNAFGSSRYVSPGLVTNQNGDVTFWLLPNEGGGNTYTFTATPPSGSNFLHTSLSNVTIASDTTVTITLQQPVILSGHVYDRSGNAVPNQTVRLGDSAGNTTSTTTNSNGEYSLQVSPGTFRLDVTGDNNPVTLEIPRRYEITKNGYSLTQSTTLDITIPAKQVITHVQDASGNSISGIEITVVPPTGVSGGGYSIGGGITNAFGSSRYVSPGLVTNQNGDVTFWLLPNEGGGNTYTFTATPPSGSIYSPFNLNNVVVVSDQTEIVSLQFIHDAPVTTANLATQNADGTYSDPTTVTLSATAAEGFTIANTYYTIDGGAQQTYSSPFQVSGDGQHAITFWSIDNVGVFENPNEQIFTINAVDQLTSLSPANIWIGLKNSDDVGTRFDLKAEVYKNSTELVSSGQLDNVWGGSSGFNNANLQTIPFNTFSPVDFPEGSTLSIKLYVRNACQGPTHNSGTARLWYDDAAANSRFDATIEGSNSNYYLRNNFVLSTAVGIGPKQKIDVQAGSKCSPFKTFGTWSITP